MIAVSIHQISVYLYKLDLNIGGTRTTSLGNHLKMIRSSTNSILMANFQALSSTSSTGITTKYPNGVADIVGYWAETRVFGGVVLFDRREPSQKEGHEDVSSSASVAEIEFMLASWYNTKNNTIQPDAIFFHSYAENITYRIWRLLDTQKKAVLDFLLSDNDIIGQPNSAPNPFPILPGRNNLTRIDPEGPIHKTGIYRDPWERKPLGDRAGDPRMHCCAFNTIDYPSWADFKRSLERALNRRYEIDDRREKEIEAEMEEEELAAKSGKQEEDEGEVARDLKADN